jgi:HlyD family secretion protein
MFLRDLYQKHRTLVALLVVACLIVIPAGFYLAERPENANFLTAVVSRGPITAEVQATGTINPLTTVPVGSFVSGTVQYIFADFNSQVSAGQVLAQLDPSIYQAQLITARGQRANAQANLKNLQATVAAMEALVRVDQADAAKAKADVAYAEANNQRQQDLFQQGVIPLDQQQLTASTLSQSQAAEQAAEAQIGQAQAQLEQTKAQVEQAKAQIQAQEGSVRLAETNLRYTTIVSPIDGTVVARNVDVGQSVAASLNAPVLFKVAQDLKRMQVYANTDESDTGNIHIGTDVTFQVDAFPDEMFHGRVSAIRLDPTTVQNVVTYDTIIDFENEDLKLLPGETAYVTIPTGHASDAIKIPNVALTYMPNLPNKTLQELYQRYHIQEAATSTHLGDWQVVWKTGPNQEQIPVAVQVGISDYQFSQCISGDLKTGDRLITAVENPLANGGTQAPGFGQGRRGGR